MCCYVLAAWCASHAVGMVVGEKPSQAASDRPRVPWEGCRPRRAFSAYCARVALMPYWWHGAAGTYRAEHDAASPNRSSTFGRHRVTVMIEQTPLKIDAHPDCSYTKALVHAIRFILYSLLRLGIYCSLL